MSHPKISAAMEKFRDIWGCSTNVYERMQNVREMNIKKIQRALEVDDIAHENACWFELQPSIRRALESRLRRLEKQKQ